MFGSAVASSSEVVIFAGPHGSGKDTLEGLFRKNNPHAIRLVRYSTRHRADGEENGIDYHFISSNEFSRMSAKGDFIEEASYPEGSTGTALADN